MSIKELKIKAIEKINSLDDEETLKDIINQLDQRSNTAEIKVQNLSQHFESISKQYNETLQKLAK
jgi:flagellar motor switch protein FliG